MPSTQKERRCKSCGELIPPDRCKTFPTTILCGSKACATAYLLYKARSASEYEPPDEGTIDSADPLFRAKVRPCGRCGQTFKQTVRWRYFCERCRYSTAVKNAEPDRSVAVSYVQRGGGA